MLGLKFYRQGIMYRLPIIYNELPWEIRSGHNFISFKIKLKRYYFLNLA